MLTKWAIRAVRRLVNEALEEFGDEVVGWLTNHLDIPGKTEDEERRIWRQLYGKLGDLFGFLLGLAIKYLKKRRQRR